MHGVHKTKILRFVLVIRIKPSQKLLLVGVHVPYYAFVSLYDTHMVIDEPGALTHIMISTRYTNTTCGVVKTILIFPNVALQAIITLVFCTHIDPVSYGGAAYELTT